MERVWSTLHRGFSVQSILTFVLTVFIAALLWVTFGSNTSIHAIDTTTASWKGASILYDGHQYFSAGDAKAGDSIGLAVGTHYYLYTADNNGAAPKTQKAFVIYFTPGTDPPTATAATFATYDYSSSRVFSNPTGTLDITMTPRGTESTYSSCSVEGIGYFICPVTVFLADTMDSLFNLIKNFFVVAPANTTNTTNDLYTAWNVIRSIANLAFIIVFLIIIYSQLTSAGISNYGLKKLLPRLIIAAILVNLSYFICAAAIDISNILGYSMQELFASIRQNTFKISNDTWTNSANITWGAIATFVLSGGAAAIGLIALAGAVGAGLYLLIPVLLGLVTTVLVVLVILAARQAIIVILVVIAPLAFVAYLLPNTEQWFKKWRDLFMTMLVFFPAFSLVFGGSQLAGGIIVQNATTIVTVIFGNAVQVAPLAITPLLLKLGGNLLGRIGGMVNNPKKGLMDRTKAWSKDRSQELRMKSLKKEGTKNPFRRVAQRLNDNNRAVKDRTSQYEMENDNRYHKTHRYEGIYQGTQGAETEKKRIESSHERDYRKLVRSDATLLKREIDMRLTADEASDAGERLSRIYEGVRSGTDMSPTKILAEFSVRAENSTRNLALSAISIQTSKRIQQNQLSDALLKNTAKLDNIQIREWAGITDKDNGAESALTYAVNLKREAEGKLIGERAQLMKHFKLDSGMRQQLTRNIDVLSEPDSAGNTYTFRASDTYARDAAIDIQMKTGSFDDFAEIIASSGKNGNAYEFRTTISDAIAAYGLPNKALFLGGRFINEVGKGNVNGITGPGSLTDWAVQSILGGKIKDEELANNDAGALQIYLDAARSGMQYINPSDAATFTANVRELKESAKRIRDEKTDLDRHATKAAKDVLDEIKNL